MKKLILSVITALCSLFVLAQPTKDIRLNQIGFYTGGPKVAAVINSSASVTTYNIKSADRVTTLYTGNLGTESSWAQSGERVKVADFSAFTEAGNFVIDIPDYGYSYPFTISKKPFVSVNKALIKAYYFNRSSIDLLYKYAGDYERAAGHPDKNVVIHASAASPNRPAGSTISSPGGWYDAGDYNSYIVNSGISTYSLLISYEHFSSYYDTLNLNIPESGNKLPDILDEIKWNTDWMLTMQDTTDGGVYTKKTTAYFCGSIQPVDDKLTRYVVTKSTAAALDFAATLAVTYRIFFKFDPAYAAKCLKAAKAAHNWAITKPTVYFTNPGEVPGPAISTGDYGDDDVKDELEWAGNELYIATKDEAYYKSSVKGGVSNPGWRDVRSLGILSLLYHRKNLTAIAFKDTTVLKDLLINVANGYTSYQKTRSPYKIVTGQAGSGDFYWGSNGGVGNQGLLLLNAYFLTRNTDYVVAALSQFDYLLGRNATTYSFITGYGSNSVKNIHHRPSESDEIDEPVPGFVAGGPNNTGYGDSCVIKGTPVAKRFLDEQRCYSQNEVAINWNAPAVYLSGALEFLNVFTGLENEAALSSVSAMVVYPVPAQDQVNVSVSILQGTEASLKVTDAMGIVHLTKPVTLSSGENTIPVDVKGLTSGVYLVHLNAGKKSVHAKIIVSGK